MIDLTQIAAGIKQSQAGKPLIMGMSPLLFHLLSILGACLIGVIAGLGMGLALGGETTHKELTAVIKRLKAKKIKEVTVFRWKFLRSKKEKTLQETKEEQATTFNDLKERYPKYARLVDVAVGAVEVMGTQLQKDFAATLKKAVK
jgi:hypothetical protein